MIRKWVIYEKVTSTKYCARVQLTLAYLCQVFGITIASSTLVGGRKTTSVAAMTTAVLSTPKNKGLFCIVALDATAGFILAGKSGRLRARSPAL